MEASGIPPVFQDANSFRETLRFVDNSQRRFVYKKRRMTAERLRLSEVSCSGGFFFGGGNEGFNL